MKSVKERIFEFVHYHIAGDGECNNVVLRSWAENHGLDLQQKYELAYFFSVTYCVESAIILFENRFELFKDISSWIKANKANLLFQSDRKYVRMRDSFERCIKYFAEKISSASAFVENVSENGKIVLRKAIPYVSSWEMFGRFSAFLFLETFVELTGIEAENATIVWKDGNTATSGLLNVYGYDKQADDFDKSRRLSLSSEKMNDMLKTLLRFISSSGGDANVTKVETSLCAYRKFYKGSRYNGYYLDRMLEEIILLKDSHPEISNELLEIRRKNFNWKYLGEIGGWNGIRRELKKAYKETGIIT